MKKAGKMKGRLYDEADLAVERTTLEAINEARMNAPIDNSFLVNSINVTKSTKLARSFGSNLPYARRQEYEHSSKRGFFRKAMFSARTNLRERIREAIEKIS